jgi:hypothetical protein
MELNHLRPFGKLFCVERGLEAFPPDVAGLANSRPQSDETALGRLGNCYSRRHYRYLERAKHVLKFLSLSLRDPKLSSTHQHTTTVMKQRYFLVFLSLPFSLDSYSVAFRCLSTGRSGIRSAVRLYSSVGDGPPSQRNGSQGGIWDDFLDPNREESENLLKAREYISDNSVSISHDGRSTQHEAHDSAPSTSQLSTSGSTSLVDGSSDDSLTNNPYMAVVSKITPSELIAKFTATAHPRVQNAVRSTILGLIGGLPKLAFDTKTITTGQRLASLMFQLQMTGTSVFLHCILEK